MTESRELQSRRAFIKFGAIGASGIFVPARGRRIGTDLSVSRARDVTGPHPSGLTIGPGVAA